MNTFRLIETRNGQHVATQEFATYEDACAASLDDPDPTVRFRVEETLPDQSVEEVFHQYQVLDFTDASRADALAWAHSEDVYGDRYLNEDVLLTEMLGQAEEDLAQGNQAVYEIRSCESNCRRPMTFSIRPSDVVVVQRIWG